LKKKKIKNIAPSKLITNIMNKTTINRKSLFFGKTLQNKPLWVFPGAQYNDNKQRRL